MLRIRNVVRITNRGRSTANELCLRVSVPPTKKHHQEIMLVNTSPNASIKTDRKGNTTAVYDITELKPGKHVNCSLTADVNIQPVSYRLVSTSKASYIPSSVCRFTHPDIALESQHPQIRYLSSKLAHFARTPIRFVRKASKTVSEYLKYEMQSSERGAAYAIERRVGDCTEFSALLVALCRANEIPARLLAGYLYDSYRWGPHAWMEFWFHGRWIPVDPTNYGHTGELGINERFILTRIGNWMNPDEQSDVALTYHSSGISRPSLSSSLDISRLQPIQHEIQDESSTNSAKIELKKLTSKSKTLMKMEISLVVTKRRRLYEKALLEIYTTSRDGKEVLALEPIQFEKDSKVATIVNIRRSTNAKKRTIMLDLRSTRGILLCRINANAQV